jgi:antirestriction protein
MKEMKVWAGCLACYNAGQLTGEWVDAADAAQTIPCEKIGHEEFWCFDTENLPNGEMGLAEATSWAEKIGATIRESGADLEAVLAYIEINNVTSNDDELSKNFEIAYLDAYESEKEFAQSFADETGAVSENLKWPLTYIDWEAATAELMLDHYSVENGHGVYIFQNN